MSDTMGKTRLRWQVYSLSTEMELQPAAKATQSFTLLWARTRLKNIPRFANTWKTIGLTPASTRGGARYILQIEKLPGMWEDIEKYADVPREILDYLGLCPETGDTLPVDEFHVDL